jgi:hypothetical protein
MRKRLVGDYYFLRLVRSLSVLLLAVANAVVAHHSPAPFDLSVEQNVDGIITEVSWRNPHVYLTLSVTASGGKPFSQEIEAVGASGMASMKVKQQDFVIGERVRVRANPNRRGAGYEVLGLVLTTAAGAVLPLRGGIIPPPLPSASTGAEGVAGAWLTDARFFAATADSLPTWPLTDAGSRAAADFAARSIAAADCNPFGIPAQMLMPGLTVITVSNSVVTIKIDGASTHRVIYLDSSDAPANTASTLQGYSTGRWEGKALVINTTLFIADPEGLGFALPSSAHKQVTERLTPSENGSTLHYEATLVDPEYLREPKTFSSTWSYHPEMQPSGQACDLESAQRFAARKR